MDTSLPSWAVSSGPGIYAVDTGFHRDDFDAAYLVVEHGRAAFIDTGTNFAVPRLLGLLDALGLSRDAVDLVIPTHVHLDHAGGVGLLMRDLPRATVWVHPRGARHMIDPTQLYQGALAVYGADEMARSYGTLVGVPADRVRESADDGVVYLAGRPLSFAHTPGHARHHHCIWDERSRGWFTGDTFGLSYREFDTESGAWIMPTSTPVQFEPESLKASVLRLLARAPDAMYLTHFGRVGHTQGDVQRLGSVLLTLLDGMVAIGRASTPGAERHSQLMQAQLDLFADSLSAHGCTLPRHRLASLLAMDLELNAQGMAIWLDRTAR